MTDAPDYERVAAVLVRIGMRLATEGKEDERSERSGLEVVNADRGLLQGVNRGAGRRGLLD
jgi:hypothetical protein